MRNASMAVGRFIAGGCWLFGVLVGSARGEIAGSHDLPTQQQYHAMLVEFNLNHCLAVYQKSGDHNDKWDTDAVAFIKDAIQRPSPQSDLQPLMKLDDRAQVILSRGCQDGLVQYLDGMILSEALKRDRAEQVLRLACQSLPAQGYPPHLLARAAAGVSTLLQIRGADGETGPFAAIVADADASIFKTHLFKNKEERDLLFGELAETDRYLNNDQLGAVWKAALGVKDADPVAVAYLEAAFRTKQAWHFRGSGFADTVTPQGWQGFEAELKKANDCYVKAWEMDKSIPEIPTAMITVAMGSTGLDDMRLWFDRAVAARFDFPTAYSNYIFGLYPRWHGNRELLMEFADECFQTGRFDTMVPYQYFEIIQHVQTECDHGSTALWRESDIYARAIEAFRKTLAGGAAAGCEADIRGHEAAFTLRAGHFDDALRVVKEGFQFDDQASLDFALTEQGIRAAANAFAGPRSELATKARQQAIDGDKKGAIESYQQAIAAQADPLAKTYLRGRAVNLQREIDFESGAEVPIKVDKDLAGFKPIRGRWTADDDGSLVGTATDELLQISCEANFGNDWDLSADIDFVHAGGGSSTGPTISPAEYVSYTGFDLNRQQKEISVRIVNHGEVETAPAPVADHNTVILKRRGSLVTAIVNGKQVYSGEPYNIVARKEIGFGGWPNGAGDVYRYSNIKIKRAAN